jgi:2-polyprenyl-3-methyl-5-hydroxy-6-metoxy-1,4-benzoquinol methylase
MTLSSRVPPECVVCRASGATRLSGTYCEEAWLCPDCGHIFVDFVPPPPELDALYEVYSYDGREECLPAFLGDILGALIDSFARHRRTGRLLDVGFGAGLLLREARARRWETHGVELSRAAVERGKAAGLGTLHLGDFVQVELAPASFDVVVMTELIEHLPDPMPFLRRAAEVLRPGGLLYMTTPHGRGLSGRMLGADWSVLRPPEHLHLFSIESARRCLNEAGFSRPHVYTQGVLPHEIVAMLRRKITTRDRLGRTAEPSATPSAAPSAEGESFDRVGSSYRLNAALMKSPVGRAFKATTNRLLRAIAVGDSLRVEAIR